MSLVTWRDLYLTSEFFQLSTYSKDGVSRVFRIRLVSDGGEIGVFDEPARPASTGPERSNGFSDEVGHQGRGRPNPRRLHHAHVLECGPRSWSTKVHTDLRAEEATK
jgi:hypothetical protein